MKKFGRLFICVFLLISILIPFASAKSISHIPYWGYEYNDYQESVAAPEGYEPYLVYYSKEMGLENPLDSATDMVFDEKQENLYVLDGGNSRIIHLSTEFQAVRIWDSFQDEKGEEKSIQNAQGISLDPQGNFFIANTSRNEVLKINRDGKVLLTISRPDDALRDTDAAFKAIKVSVDRKGKIYVLAESMNMGAFVFNEAGEFVQFFGSNPVNKTGEVLRQFFWKRFMTKEQRKGMGRITPTTFHNFDVDSYGFLYTVTADNATTSKPNTVRRLNYNGINILPKDLIFGDLEWDRAYKKESKYTSFIDVDIDRNGYINLLDNGRGKVFQYTENGELLTVFGSHSDQIGGFSEPVAIETAGDNILVLDAVKNCIIHFRPTRYGANMRAAFLSMRGSDAEQSLGYWNKVLEQNTNSQYPYYGIGMVYDSQGRYAQAMKYFKLAGAHEEYSKSFREYRKTLIGDYYWLLILILAAGVFAAVLLIKKTKKKFIQVRGTAFSAIETKNTFPLYTALHPADGFEQFKTRKIASYKISAILLFLFFAISTASFFYRGYAFNNNRPVDYKFFITFASSTGIVMLFIIANWAACTLMDGKGSLKEITAVCAYSLIPYLASQSAALLLSNVLTLEESTFISLTVIIGLLWTIMILLIGLQTIHQYGFIQTLGSVLLTAVGMAAIVFLAVLFFTLIQQTINFFNSIIMELSLR